MSKEGKLLFRGEEGESLFTKPFISPPGERIFDQELFEKMRRTRDDRSLAIVSALVLEYCIDDLLQTWIPEYNKLAENRDFTFSMKIDLLDAFKLVPHHILKCADCVRKIRNDFAHDLDLDSFEQIKQKNKNILKAMYEHLFGNSTSQGKSTRELFEKVAWVAIVGVCAYKPNIAILREVIQSNEFLEELEEKSKTKFDKIVENIIREGPKKIEFKCNLKIERFSKGVVKISRIDD